MKRVRSLAFLVSCVLVIGLLAAHRGASAQPPAETIAASRSSATDWTQWRGPERNGRYSGPAWPDGLGEERLIREWSVKFGPSYSGPIVAGGRVFVTETKDRKWEEVHALDAETGERLWTQRWEGSMQVPFFAATNGSWIRATPACDGESLYVAGMRDVLVCLDAATGEQRWRVDFTERYKTPLPAFGFVSSPLVVGQYVYVQAGASFLKLDKRTGETIWRTLDDGGGMYGSAFSSPVFATVAGKPQLIVQTRKSLAGVDAETGDVLWSREIEAFRGMNILTPTVLEDRIFTSAYGGKSLLFRLENAASDEALEPIWTNRAQGYMSSPAVIDGHVYLHLRNRRFTCIRLSDGETTWTTEPMGQYWSMVSQGDRILALADDGTLRLIQADPEKFQLLDQRKLTDDSTWAHLAVRGNQLFVRELGALSVYRWK